MVAHICNFSSLEPEAEKVPWVEGQPKLQSLKIVSFKTWGVGWETTVSDGTVYSNACPVTANTGMTGQF